MCNEAIKPDKMLSLLVYQIKKHMESYFPEFSTEDKSEAAQMAQNQFVCTGCPCKHALPFPSVRHFHLLAACHSDSKGISWSLSINNKFKLSYLWDIAITEAVTDMKWTQAIHYAMHVQRGVPAITLVLTHNTDYKMKKKYHVSSEKVMFPF